MGLSIVTLSASLWVLPNREMRFVVSVCMAVAAVMLAVGRFLQTPFYRKYALSDPRELTLRRLYHQRVFGILALGLASTFMFVPTGFYGGMYVGKASWLVPFILFVVVEVYTTFRISAVDRD